MKKCPNCGTILDDSKKSCYMCGASLDISNKLDFGAAIDAAVGSKVTKEADNVFNNGEDIKVKGKDVVPEDNGSAFFGKDNDAFGVFGENINSLNNMKPTDPDEIASLEEKKQEETKIKEEQELKQKQEAEKMNALLEKKKKQEEDARKKDEEIKERQRLREEKNKERKAQKEAEKAALLEKRREVSNCDQPNNKSFFNFSKDDNQVIASDVPKEKINSEINWGDNLKKNFDPKNKTITISKSFVFNTVCVIIFISMLVFVYFKFLKAAPDTSLEIGSLKYSISDEFHLASSDSSSRYYTYGDSCNLRITYGQPNDSGNYIDNYFDTQKENFINDDSLQAINESMVINDNKWEVLKIVEYASSPSSSSGLTEITKYRYVSIIHDNKYYTTVFVNVNNDSTCSAMYNNFVDSLEF